MRTAQVDALPGFTPLGLGDTTIKVTKQDVWAIIKATFPDYRGRKIVVKPKSSISVCHADLNWSGGSRYQYRACSLSGQPTGSLDRHNASAPWEKAPGSTSIQIPLRHCIVEHVIFCGKDLGLRIYVRPEDMPRLLRGV
jgi:hypothetical protein